MKKFLILLLVGLVALGQINPLFALTAKEIITKVDNLEDGDTSISKLTMILIDKKGNKRIRKTKGFRKDYGEDTKSITYFLSPADVKNTTFLAFDYDDEAKEDDNWLYLPALRKVKRIASGNKKDSFMGTDFSYHDMNGLNIDEWDYQIIKESAKIDGHDCWVIGSVPKKAIAKAVIKDTGYLKRVGWIRKDNFMMLQSKIWVKKGKKLKVLKASEIKKIQDIWTVGKLEMKTLDRKGRLEHATVLLFDEVLYNKGVDDNTFTTQQMERGL
ncbi:MAG: outer membrane lipoprotein-sorting protein [SAR324 cluster bacterium]|nr:outer membrane lipoprotein-sorting protein [SAR324 cluster bacterium]